MLPEENKNELNIERLLVDLRSRWPSAIVAREQISDFSGGLLKSRTMANRDSLGSGIDERFRVGNKVVYPIDAVINYIRKMVEDKS